jgi:uncharacterized protein (DUF342 family)
MHGFNVVSTSELRIPSIFSPMVLENTKYGVDVSSSSTRVTECFVDTGSELQKVQTQRTAFRHRKERGRLCSVVRSEGINEKSASKQASTTVRVW